MEKYIMTMTEAQAKDAAIAIACEIADYDYIARKSIINNANDSKKESNERKIYKNIMDVLEDDLNKESLYTIASMVIGNKATLKMRIEQEDKEADEWAKKGNLEGARVCTNIKYDLEQKLAIWGVVNVVISGQLQRFSNF